MMKFIAVKPALLAVCVSCLVLFLALPVTSVAQESPETILTMYHWLSLEEMTRLDEIGMAFVETDPPIAPVRNIAEFDYMQGVLVRYPFGIPIELIREMAEDVVVTTVVKNTGQQNTVLNQYVANGVDTSHCNFLIAESNSHWTRDYGPWFVSDSANQIGIVDFPYNRPRPLDDEIPKILANSLKIPWYGMYLIHTGGNYMTDGFGNSASTDLTIVENPQLTPQQIDEKVLDYLGVTEYHLVPDPNVTSSIDHIDCWGKFLAPDKILIREVPSGNASYAALEQAVTYWESQTCAYGYNYEVVRIQTPGGQPYTNSLILNNKVLVPIMNSTWDDSAIVAYQQAMPGYEVIGILAQPSTPWMSTDALHCRTKGIADTGLLYIHHLPLYGSRPCEEDYEINASLIVCSDTTVVEDSVLIHYRVNGGAWEIVTMENTSGDDYTGYIPAQPGLNTVEYYLSAADDSGRHANAPFIGEPDPFEFNTVYSMLTPVPDTLFFNTLLECMEGKVTVLNNFTDGKIIINDIPATGTGSGFWWNINTLPVLPVLLNSGDTVELRVTVVLPVLEQLTGYAIDTLLISTSGGDVPVIIAVNDELITAIDDINMLADVHLGNVYPNPFTSHTTIPFILTQKDHVSLLVYDITGKEVTTLINEQRPAGNHQITWDGTDGAGQKAKGGIFVYTLKTSTKVISKRMVFIR